ncbi:MAG TPA: glycosyltransferase family 39 protein, partial [Chloroflexota bacterium]|nr:glycosyltransferase family 39 protein [Chloroflexota bacterium]
MLSAFLQFYRLNDLQHFQGDEGLSVLAVRALIINHQFPVSGLALAVGSAHIGPLFDYLIALPLWIFHYDPTAAVALNGICQVLVVGLCYGLMTRHGGGRVAGLAAALVLATSQEVVYYSRFLWPNMLPCLVVLSLWSLLELRQGRQRHLALLGIWTGVALQLQPTAVLLAPFYLLYLLVFRPPIRSWRYALLGLAAMLLLFAPVIVHELTHGLVETRAWLAYGHHRNGGYDRALGPTLARVA